jgi:hypothetical protein
MLINPKLRSLQQSIPPQRPKMPPTAQIPTMQKQLPTKTETTKTSADLSLKQSIKEQKKFKCSVNPKPLIFSTNLATHLSPMGKLRTNKI